MRRRRRFGRRFDEAVAFFVRACRDQDARRENGGVREQEGVAVREGGADDEVGGAGVGHDGWLRAGRPGPGEPHVSARVFLGQHVYLAVFLVLIF